MLFIECIIIECLDSIVVVMRDRDGYRVVAGSSMVARSGSRPMSDGGEIEECGSMSCASHGIQSDTYSMVVKLHDHCGS